MFLSALKKEPLAPGCLLFKLPAASLLPPVPLYMIISSSTVCKLGVSLVVVSLSNCSANFLNVSLPYLLNLGLFTSLNGPVGINVFPVSGLNAPLIKYPSLAKPGRGTHLPLEAGPVPVPLDLYIKNFSPLLAVTSSICLPSTIPKSLVTSTVTPWSSNLWPKSIIFWTSTGIFAKSFPDSTFLVNSPNTSKSSFILS